GLRTSLSTARLVSGDGDSGGAFGSDLNHSPPPTEAHGSPAETSVGYLKCGNVDAREKPDIVPDWSVGELGSKRDARGTQALAFSTVTRPALVPDTVKHDPTPSDLTAGHTPTDQEKMAAYLESQYFLLPSYSLNSIDVIDPTGTGWAVGEHGAIL